MTVQTKVLKILDRNIIYNESVKSILLESGEIAVPAVHNKLGIFVYKTKQNEKYLDNKGLCFISGYLMKLEGEEFFFPDDDRLYLQLVLNESVNLTASLFTPDLFGKEVITTEIPLSVSRAFSEAPAEVPPTSKPLLFEGVEQVVLLSTLLNQKLFSINKFLHSIPVPIRSGGFSFEIFFKKKGQARGVYLVLPELGLSRVVLEKDSETRSLKAVTKSKLPVVNLNPTK